MTIPTTASFLQRAASEVASLSSAPLTKGQLTLFAVINSALNTGAFVFTFNHPPATVKATLLFRGPYLLRASITAGADYEIERTMSALAQQMDAVLENEGFEFKPEFEHWMKYLKGFSLNRIAKTFKELKPLCEYLDSANTYG